MPRYVIGQKTLVDLQPQNVIGSGGEGTVFRASLPGGSAVALKTYHSFSAQRADKLRSLQKIGGALPQEVVGPIELVWDEQGQRIVGFTMRLLPSGQQPFETLTIRKHREANNITTKEVVDIFIRLQNVLRSLHSQGVIVGDLNPLNELYRQLEIALIDADSFQFGQYPCGVATERCLHPRLYGVDLSLRPVFKPGDDWYSFLVLLFSSLLLVHPYGGAHRKLRTIPKRALNRIMVLDSSVIYPKVAYPPEIVTDDLMQLFTEVFAQGKERIPDPRLLEEYGAILVGCPTCGLWYPHHLITCPGCDALNQQAQALKAKIVGVETTELLATQGPLVFFKLVGATMYTVVVEGIEAVLYIKKQLEKPRRVRLFKAVRGARYDVFGQNLVICPAPYDHDQPPLFIFDVSGDQAKPLAQTVTDRFGNRGAVFRGTARYLYRVVGGILQRGSIPTGKVLVEETVAAVMNQQTWFDAAPRYDRELLFGFYRIFDQYEWFLLNNGVQNQIFLPVLQRGESMVDRAIRFSQSSLLLLRRTRKAGEENCLIGVIDLQSGEVRSSRRVSLRDNPQFANIHAVAYARGTILIPQDDGLLAENAQTGKQRLFSETANYVNSGVQLRPYDQGILVIHPNKVIKLVIQT
jgi:hypothetical protein